MKPEANDKDLVSMGDLDLNPGDKDNDKDDAAAKAAAAAAAAKAAETVDIAINGSTYKVPADVKAALDAALAAGADVATLKTQLAEVSRQLEAAKPKAAPKADEGYSVLLFADPDKAIAKLRDEIAASVMASVQQTNTQREFWEEFFNQNKELKEYDDYVRFEFAKNRETYVKDGITVAEAMNKLAESSKAGLLKIRGGVPLGGKSKEFAEGGSDGNSGRRSKSKEGGEEEEMVSTASILNARKEARRQASKPGRKR